MHDADQHGLWPILNWKWNRRTSVDRSFSFHFFSFPFASVLLLLIDVVHRCRMIRLIEAAKLSLMRLIQKLYDGSFEFLLFPPSRPHARSRTVHGHGWNWIINVSTGRKSSPLMCETTCSLTPTVRPEQIDARWTTIHFDTMERETEIKFSFWIY